MRAALSGVGAAGARPRRPVPEFAGRLRLPSECRERLLTASGDRVGKLTVSVAAAHTFLDTTNGLRSAGKFT
jgi:hypothetical protein